MTASFSGAILCGGASRRMGTNKALIRIDGVPMVVRVERALREAGADDVLAIGGAPAAFADLGLDVRPDQHPGSGPLGGTITALTEARHEVVMVVACDLIRPTAAAMAATVRALTDHPGAVAAVPVDDGHRQWTHAAWRTWAVSGLAAAHAAGERSLRRAGADLLVFDLFGLAPDALADADAPGDLPGGSAADG